MKISIKHKFTLLYLIIFILSILTSTTYMKKAVEKNNENIVKRESLELMLSSRDYLKHYMLLNEIDTTPEAFTKYSNQIADELNEKNNCSVELYTPKGEIIAISTLINQETILDKRNNEDSRKDISLAQKNTATASISKIGNEIYVKFSFPVHINGVYLGIIRFIKNYTDIYNAGKALIKMLTLFTTSLFFLIFTISYFLTSKITNPLLILRRALKKIASGNYDCNINIKNKDEIGDLAKDFCSMRDKIKMQITTIEEDNERILKAEKHRQEFFNNVTHELKTPLTTISGYAQILEEEAFSSDELYKRAVKRIHSESERLHSLVVELLEISKKNTQHSKEDFQKIDFSKLVSQICSDLNLKARKYGMKVVSKPTNSLVIKGIKNEIKELVINLLDNAIKYGYPDTEIKVKTYANKKNAYLEIKNFGKGIPETKKAKIFEPFFRVENHTYEKESSGLGLFICKNIVERHLGKIEIESIENESTKVIVKIPLFRDNLATFE